jgi:hypothetical protein
MKMFFVSLLIFVGGILFDLYFSYKSLNDMCENWGTLITRIIIYVLSIVAIFGLVVSVLGICDIFCVITNDGIRYITFKNDELKSLLSVFQGLEIEFGKFLTVLFIEIVSCLPDFLIHRINIKAKNKKKD